MLTPEERARFDEDGFVRGFAICTPDEMVLIRREIEATLEESGPYLTGPATKFRHLDSRLVYELCARPEVVDRVASILGPDVIVWHSRFFNKIPRSDGCEPWHQDEFFWPIEPKIGLSAWIAIDRADRENGCLQMIPGSHRRRIPHVDLEGVGFWGSRADPAFVDETKKVLIELEPGEFVIFDGRVLHYSPPNTSDRRRLALAVRFIPPQVKVDIQGVSRVFSKREYGVQVVHGSDTVGLNHILPAPSDDAAAKNSNDRAPRQRTAREEIQPH